MLNDPIPKIYPAMFQTVNKEITIKTVIRTKGNSGAKNTDLCKVIASIIQKLCTNSTGTH